MRTPPATGPATGPTEAARLPLEAEHAPPQGTRPAVAAATSRPAPPGPGGVAIPAPTETERPRSRFESLSEGEFDDLTYLAAQLCATPMALICLGDAERQWTKSKVGISAAAIPRETLLFPYSVRQKDVFAIADAAADARFVTDSLVTGPAAIRFIAGAPLLDDDDKPLGALCVLDRAPRQLNDAQADGLRALARQAMRHLEMHRHAANANAGPLGHLAGVQWPELDLDWSAAEEHFKGAFDHAVIGMALVSPEGRWLTTNPSLCGIVGYTEQELLDTDFQAITHPDDLESDLALLNQVLGGDIFSYQKERRYMHRRGHVVWVLLSVSLVRDSSNQPRYFIFQIEDITDRKGAQEELTQAHEELKGRVAELERRTTELGLIGEMGELLQSCRSVAEAYKIIGRSIRQLFPDENGSFCVINSARDHVEAVVTWGKTVSTESYFIPDDCWALRRNRMHIVEDAEVDLICTHIAPAFTGRYMCLPLTAQRETLGLLHLSSTEEDGLSPARQQLARTLAEQISLALANIHLQETLRSQSVRDGLTGLFNRRYLEESLEREINRSHRNERALAIIMLDVDHFKKFNDTYGHELGDTVLREVAAQLQTHLRKADVACRYGGEEFLLILPEASLEDARQKAEQIREAVKHIMLRHERGAIGSISLSLGVAAFPQHGDSADTLISTADAALYRAKTAGRDRVMVAE